MRLRPFSSLDVARSVAINWRKKLPYGIILVEFFTFFYIWFPSVTT